MMDARHALTVMTRLAQRHPDRQRHIEDLLDERLADLGSDAIEVAKETGNPMGNAIASALARSPRPELAVELERLLPDSTVSLIAAGVEIGRQAVDELMRLGSGMAGEPPLGFLVNHAVRLGWAGEREEALEVARRAVALVESGGWPMNGIVIRAYGALADALSDLGRDDESVSVAERAVAHARDLASHDDSWTGRWLPLLLNNLAMRYGTVLRHDDAVVAAAEAVECARREGDGPGALATCLHGLANQSGRVGRWLEAVAAGEEAVTLLRALADRNPDAHLADLAAALTDHSCDLSSVGRYDDALAAARDAREIYARLSLHSPAAFAEERVAALMNHSYRLNEAGRHDEALQVDLEAVHFAKLNADEYADACGPAYAMALDNLSTSWSNVGRFEQALEAAEKAIAILRSLASGDPRRFTFELASALNNAASAALAMGLNERALDLAEEAAAFYEAWPDRVNADWLDRIGAALHTLSVARSETGDVLGAQAAARAAVDSRRRHAEAGDGDADDADLAECLMQLAACSTALDDGDGVLAALGEAADVLRPLAARAPVQYGLSLLEVLSRIVALRGGTALVREADVLARRIVEGAGPTEPALIEDTEELLHGIRSHGGVACSG